MSDTSIQAEAPAPESTPRTTPKKAMLIVFLVVFIDLIGFAIVLPLLPIYGERYVEPLVGKGEHSTAGGAIIGLLMSCFSAMQFLFAPVWGRISDRVGRRSILLIGLAGSVVCYALFGYASDLPADVEYARFALTLLFIARIGAGIAGATIATAQAVIADSTTVDRRKHGMALIGFAFGIGFTFGPLIGAGAIALRPDWLGLAGYIASGLSLLALLIAIAIMPETRRFGEESVTRRKWFDSQAIRTALGNPAVAPVLWTFFLATLGFSSFETTLSPLNNDVMRLPKENNYLVFAHVGFVLMVTQGVFYRRLANRVSEASFMAMGIGLMAVGLLSLCGVSYLASTFRSDEALPRWVFVNFLVSLTCAVIGFAFMTPSAQALVSRRSDPERQGEILGVNQSASSMARILGPMAGMSLYGLTAGHLLPYFFGAVMLFAMLLLIPTIRRGGNEADSA